MPDLHFAARNLITKGRDNTQDERMNPEYGFRPCKSLPHFAAPSDHSSLSLNKVGRRQWLLWHISLPTRGLKPRLSLPLLVTTLTQLQIPPNALCAQEDWVQICSIHSSLHAVTQQISTEHLSCVTLSATDPGFLGLKWYTICRTIFKKKNAKKM